MTIRSKKKKVSLGISRWAILFVSLMLINNFKVTYNSDRDTDYLSLEHIGPISNSDPTSFLSKWDTRFVYFGSSSENQIHLPLIESGRYNFVVQWGDGTNDVIKSYSDPKITHTYDVPGAYMINITGDLEGWQFNTAGDCVKLIEISQWGTINLGNDGSYFYGCNNLSLSATDALNLTGTTSLYRAFGNCRKLGSNGNMNGWDVSSVTNMRSMFGWSNFNQNICEWDVSSVTDMGYMFSSTKTFNQDIGEWDVSSVTNMSHMFYGASSFNQNICEWNVSGVSDMESMFLLSYSFDQNIGGWDISSVTDMRAMFYEVTLSTKNYNSILQGWAQLSLQNNVSFHAGDSRCSYGDAKAAREYLINTFEWIISDGGLSDDLYPDWVEVPENHILDENQSFSYQVNATDKMLISNFWLNDTSIFNISPIGLITNITNMEIGRFHLKVFVNYSRETNLSASFLITVLDNSLPAWGILPSDQTLDEDQAFGYQVSAIDNVAIDTYWLNNTSTFAISSTGMITNITNLEVGRYYLKVFVNDTSGNEINFSIFIEVEESTTKTSTTTTSDNQEDDFQIPGYSITILIYISATSLIVGIFYLKKRR